MSWQIGGAKLNSVVRRRMLACIMEHSATSFRGLYFKLPSTTSFFYTRGIRTRKTCRLGDRKIERGCEKIKGERGEERESEREKERDR